MLVDYFEALQAAPGVESLRVTMKRPMQLQTLTAQENGTASSEWRPLALGSRRRALCPLFANSKLAAFGEPAELGRQLVEGMTRGECPVGMDHGNAFTPGQAHRIFRCYSEIPWVVPSARQLGPMPVDHLGTQHGNL